MHGSQLLKKLKITFEKGKRTKRPSGPWACYSCPITDRALLTVLLCQGPQPCIQTHVMETVRNDRHLLPNPHPVLDDSSTFTGHFNKPRSRGSGDGIPSMPLAPVAEWDIKTGRLVGFCQSGCSCASNPRQTRDPEKQGLMEERPFGYYQELDCKLTGVWVGPHCTQSIDA